MLAKTNPTDKKPLQSMPCPVCYGECYPVHPIRCEREACDECGGLGMVPDDRPDESPMTEAEMDAMARHFGQGA